MTGSDLIASALRLINVTASGEVASGAEINDALFVLNSIIDGWQAERLMIFTIQRQVFVPGSLKQVYTIGTGGDFNVARPPKIDRAGILTLGNPAQPLEIPIDYTTDANYQLVPVKGIPSAIPRLVWDDQQFPLRNLTYWPVPNVSIQMVLYTWTALQTFTDLTTDFTFPPGYQAALRYNLAIKLAPEFNRAVPPEIRDFAADAKAKVKSMNIQPIDLRCDPALVNPRSGYYNWLTDAASRSFRGS